VSHGIASVGIAVSSSFEPTDAPKDAPTEVLSLATWLIAMVGVLLDVILGDAVVGTPVGLRHWKLAANPAATPSAQHSNLMLQSSTGVVGASVGEGEGKGVGGSVGSNVGMGVGTCVGTALGVGVGEGVGTSVGSTVGVGVGTSVGVCVGL